MKKRMVNSDFIVTSNVSFLHLCIQLSFPPSFVFIFLSYSLSEMYFLCLSTVLFWCFDVCSYLSVTAGGTCLLDLNRSWLMSVPTCHLFAMPKLKVDMLMKLWAFTSANSTDMLPKTSCQLQSDCWRLVFWTRQKGAHMKESFIKYVQEMKGGKFVEQMSARIRHLADDEAHV